MQTARAPAARVAARRVNVARVGRTRLVVKAAKKSVGDLTTARPSGEGRGQCSSP